VVAQPERYLAHMVALHRNGSHGTDLHPKSAPILVNEKWLDIATDYRIIFCRTDAAGYE